MIYVFVNVFVLCFYFVIVCLFDVSLWFSFLHYWVVGQVTDKSQLKGIDYLTPPLTLTLTLSLTLTTLPLTLIIRREPGNLCRSNKNLCDLAFARYFSNHRIITLLHYCYGSWKNREKIRPRILTCTSVLYSQLIIDNTCFLHTCLIGFIILNIITITMIIIIIIEEIMITVMGNNKPVKPCECVILRMILSLLVRNLEKFRHHSRVWPSFHQV